MKRILFYLQFMQDMDWLLPVMEAYGRSDEFELHVLIEEELRSKAQTESLLKARVLHYRLPRESGVCLLERLTFHFLFTASESTARPHARAHELVCEANRRGVTTITIQHGYENIGLTYSDREYPIQNIRFASSRILTWCSSSRFHPQLPVQTQHKLLPVRFFKRAPRCLQNITFRQEVSSVALLIAENLHWKRYTHDLRREFHKSVEALCVAFPELKIYLKPHPHQRWSSTHLKAPLRRFLNLHWLEDDVLPQERLLGLLSTPSTLIVDAVMKDMPVAVFHKQVSSAYESLPHLCDSAEVVAWVQKLIRGEEQTYFRSSAEAFKTNVLLETSPVISLEELPQRFGHFLVT